MKANKKLLIGILAVVVVLLAVILCVIIGQNSNDNPHTNSSETTTPSTESAPTTPPVVKKTVTPVSDLAVSTRGVATFTHTEGLQYQILIDGKAVEVTGVNGQYDIYQLISDGTEHTVTVKSKENDKYLESEPSNAVKVKALDTSAVNLSYNAQTQEFSFNEVEGFTYKLSVNGEEMDIPEDRNISSLIPVGSTVFIDLVIKGDDSGDVIILDALLNILTITYHPEITDFALNNGVVTFSELPGYTYALYCGDEMVLDSVSTGANIEEVLKKVTGSSATFTLQITGDAEKNTYVLDAQKVSNAVTAMFLSAPSVSVSENAGIIMLNITDRANSSIQNLHYLVYVNDEFRGSISTLSADISKMFDAAGDASVKVQAMADGYYAYNSVSNTSMISVPDYNRFHYTFDNAMAEVGGLVSDNWASIMANTSNVEIGTNLKLNLTQGTMKDALIVIENPSDHPAGIQSLQVNIVSKSDPSKFIRIVVDSNNGYNTHIYGGYGDALSGSMRENHGLVDATFGQIVDYNILWTAFLLGTTEGDYGFQGWNTVQKMPLVLVHDSGYIGYFTPNGKFVPFIDLSEAEGFDAQDFTDASVNYVIGNIKSSTDQGFGKATFTLDFYGTGEDYTDDYAINYSGLKLNKLETNETKGVYLIVTPFNTVDVDQGAAEWIAMGGTLTTGKITINGVSHELVIKYAGAKNKIYIDFGEYKSYFDAAVALGETMYITIPADGTLTGDWDGAITWSMIDTYTICNTPVDGHYGQWQICTHNHTNGLPDLNQLPNRVTASINTEQTRKEYISFTLSIGNGFDVENWDEFITVPEGAKLNNSALLLKRAGPGLSFYIEGGAQIAVGDIVVFPAGDYYNANTGKGITLDKEYKLKWTGEAWEATTDSYEPPAAPDKVAGTVADEQTRKDYITFTMAQNNGFEAENWDEFITVPEGAKLNNSALLLKRAGPGLSFYIEGSAQIAVGDIVVFPAGDYYNANTGKGITLDKEYKLKWTGEAWEATTDEYIPPMNCVAATINSEGHAQNYIYFTMSENNGFEAENWDVFVTVPEGAKYNDSPLQLKRAGGGTSFYVEGSNNAAVGDVITFAAGNYYNGTTGKGITLAAEQCFKWDGTSWVATTDSFVEPNEFDVTLSQEVKRDWWWGFEMFLEGTNVTVGPANEGITVEGEVLLDGVKIDPWFVVSDYDWGTGSYPIIIKTSDGKVWADEAAYNADKAAGTVHHLTVKAGTKLTVDGKTYTITADANYRISTENGEYKWRYTTDAYTPVTLNSTVKRHWWWGLEMYLDGTEDVFTANSGITVAGTGAYVDGEAASPWFVVSDYDWGTGKYPIIIKTENIWANDAAYQADATAGVEHTITVKAGTLLTIDGKTYTVVKDVSYLISTINGEYKWRQVKEVTLSQEVKRDRWHEFEMFLEGENVKLGPANSGLTVIGDVLLDGTKIDPWFVVSDYDWETGNYALSIKTSDGKVWADSAAYEADKAAGTEHQITIKAGTKLLSADGILYNITKDVNYRISLVDGEYKWRYVAE